MSMFKDSVKFKRNIDLRVIHPDPDSTLEHSRCSMQGYRDPDVWPS